NYIHTLSNASTSGLAVGMVTIAGSVTYRNNMIRLGLDAAGSGITTATGFIGYSEAAGNVNFYHNSIYIGGTGVGTTNTNTFAFNSTTTLNTRNYQNNIFFNARSNTSTGGKHYAIRVGGSAANPSGLVAGYNIMFANGTGGVMGLFFGTDYSTVSTWNAAVGSNNNLGNISNDPEFIAPNGSSTTGDLHIHATNPTPAEATGLNLSASVPTDFDGTTRSGVTPHDIGADAGNFTAAPNMTYTSSTVTQTNTSTVATATTNQQVIGLQVVTSGSLNPINITSITFNTTGTTNVANIANAKLWSTGTSSTFATTTQFGSTVAAPNGSHAVTGSVTLLAGTNYFWLTYDVVCGSTPTNVIDAEITAIDVSGAQTPTVTAPSGTRSIVQGPLNGTYTVGSGGDFASLTAAIADINSKGLGGNTTLSILNNL
ncbi:MAG: BNR-repeat neuraminidase N-terminal domain-containing protein, partial [Dolichospermum sp.]